VREAVAVLGRLGCAVDIDADGKHFKVRWLSRGRKHVLVVSRSPSDHRARKNSAAQLKRLLRANEEARP
jgi:hypothetical protein